MFFLFKLSGPAGAWGFSDRPVSQARSRYGAHPDNPKQLQTLIRSIDNCFPTNSEGQPFVSSARGAATLLRSNIAIERNRIVLSFRSNGGKQIAKESRPRLFQFRAEHGEMRRLTAREVDDFLRELARMRMSLKDFRTLLARVGVLGSLAGHRQAQPTALNPLLTHIGAAAASPPCRPIPAVSLTAWAGAGSAC
jgi:hypothetical protein